MANTYYKLINNNLASKYSHDIVDSIQKDLYTELNKHKTCNNFTKRTGLEKKIDINTLLTYYFLDQILSKRNTMQFLEEEIEEKVNFRETKNSDIQQCKETGVFYIIKDGERILANNITQVNMDGSYVVIENEHMHSYKIKKEFSREHNLLTMQLIYKNNSVETNKHYAAEILQFKKIFTKKHKYRGYSGNSKDVVASVLNTFSSPIDTGYYMDKYCNCYKWSDTKHSFVRSYKTDSISPLLVDYEFLPNGNVIKKEYIGQR